MGKLDPESGGGGVENSEIGYSRQEARANWEVFKGKIETLNPQEDFKALWEKMKAMVEALIAKLPM